MDMSKFKVESHVAQQSRRDKLREQDADLVHHSGNFHLQANHNLDHVRNVPNANLLYDPALHTSNAHHFSTNPDEILYSKVGTADRQGCGDWMVSFASGSSSMEGNNQNPLFGGGAVMSNNVRENSNIFSTTQSLKQPAYNGSQDVQSLSINPCNDISGQDRRQYSELHVQSPQFFSTTVLQDVVTTASVGNQIPEGVSLLQQNIRDVVRRSWASDYLGNQSGSFHFDAAASSWMDASPQGLALSLSSNPTPKVCIGEEFGSDGLHSRAFDFMDHQDSKDSKPFSSLEKPSIIIKASERSLQDIVGSSTYIHRHTGPLGPFTGYATILKNSRFLKPAQELIEDLCKITNSNLDIVCKASEGSSGEASVSASADAYVADTEAAAGNNSGALSSTFYNSNDNSGGGGGLGSSSSGQPYRPDYQQKKARLLYLQGEVFKRYKLHHQQMQLVVSSFESVSGLSAATPYISLALKAVARNFRSLRNAISDQIKHISRALGEDVFSPTAGTSSSKGDINKLKFIGHKLSGVNAGYAEPQQHGWRPQRGLPERSVAILRAWLFEHFLHPYPTDTDKHMLANQTGLTRNQVSNWFINARVRVWKPMVEEIHMLESKGSVEASQISSSRTDAKSATEGSSGQKPDEQAIFSPSVQAMSSNSRQQQLLSSISDIHYAVSDRETCNDDQWNQEKRSRIDFHGPTNMDGSLISFVPYQRSQHEMGGAGAVSLTLGLRHGVDNTSRQQQQQQFHQQEDQFRRLFGGHMIHDFVG